MPSDFSCSRFNQSIRQRQRRQYQGLSAATTERANALAALTEALGAPYDSDGSSLAPGSIGLDWAEAEDGSTSWWCLRASRRAVPG